MSTAPPRLGLRENAAQFALLVLINAFVGGMVGLERSILPALAEQEFGIASTTAILSFIVAFGLSKAFANYYTGKLANRFGRKRLLVLGWWLALPVPLILIYASHWNWVLFANLLLGLSQGLTWSSTVVMKIDLVGQKNRGLAMGLNEFAGYLAVGLVAFLSASIAERYGLRPYPFWLGIGIALTGLLLSVIWVRDTRPFVKLEQSLPSGQQPLLRKLFWDTTWRHPGLGSVSQAGMVNNLNDGMIWGLLPLLLLGLHFGKQDIGILAGIYPTVWGLGQLFTGKMADHYPKKALLFWGMLAQGLAIFALVWVEDFWSIAAVGVILGLGTALVYPTFLTSIAALTHPQQRAESIGVFRLWRDLGYAVGALISGLVADWLGLRYAIGLIAILTLLSALIIALRMPRVEQA